MEKVETLDASTAARELGETPAPAEKPEVSLDPFGDKIREEGNTVPDWARGVFPAQMDAHRKPPPGKRVYYMNFRAEWTEIPAKGNQVVAAWGLNLLEERAAIERAARIGSGTTPQLEMAKQMIRACNGRLIDLTESDTSGITVDRDVVWNDIGPACRSIVVALFLRTHTLDASKQLDFFANCFAAVTS